MKQHKGSDIIPYECITVVYGGLDSYLGIGYTVPEGPTDTGKPDSFFGSRNSSAEYQTGGPPKPRARP